MNWKLEMGGPGALSKLGWNPKSVKAGDTITVDAWQAKNENNFASAKSLRFADGRELYAGSSFFDLQRVAAPKTTAESRSKAGQTVATSGRVDKPAGQAR